jgi:two-component system response regulator HydG
MYALADTSVLYNHLHEAAQTKKPVLLCGGNDTGKECVAEAIHLLSNQRERPFITVECGKQGDKMFLELINPVKKDVSDILHEKEWLLEAVSGGTVYLRKVTNLTPEQEKEVFDLFESADLRVIENTVKPYNHPLCGEDMLAGQDDLHIITIPSLRNRKDDINFFAHHFLEQANEEWHRQITGFTPDFMQALHGYSWPRNLQQLKEVVRQAMFLTKDGEMVEADSLPEEITTATTRRPSIVLRDIASRAEYELILDALKQCRYNKKQAAKMLNISRKTLYSKLKKATAYN